MHDAHVSQKFVSAVTTYPLSKESRSSTRRPSSSEAQVAGAEPLEGRAIRSNDVRIDRVCCRNQPCVVLTHPTRSAPLQERTAACLCQVKTLYRKPLQRSCGCNGVDCAFEQFLDGDDRNHERSPAQRRQEPARRALFAGSGLAIKVDQKGRVQQSRAPHRFFCARPRPLPRDASTHSIRSSPVSIGLTRSIKARITSDFALLLRRAQRARRAARFLSSFTVTVGMVIPRYYHRCPWVPTRGLLVSMQQTTWHTDARRGPTCSMGQVIVSPEPISRHTADD
jgi:hypothetical protein